MLRKLAIAIAASGAMISTTNVLALGMGDIKLESALNQPLNARIKLLKANELENWEMKPNLASSEQFDKSGVEYVFFLSDLKFAIERSGDDVYVHVTSNQAVVEPFLNFLVQVDWPSGRLLREYTLLLDPPVFNDDPVQAVQPAQGQSSGAAYTPPLPGTAPNANVSAPRDKWEPQAPSQPQETEDTYNVRENDTLWEVAIRTRPNRNITPQQAMLALQDLNPTAFINGNINRLKKNQVLRVPDEQQMLSRSSREAVAEVAIQNQVIAQRKAQLDATRKDTAMQRDEGLSDAQLTLLAGGDATTENERSASGQVAAKTAGDQSTLEQDLSVTLENLDKSTRENQELRSRLDSLEEQINTLQRLINLKDEQMIALQSGMAVKPDAADSTNADAAVTDASDSNVPTDASDDLNFPSGTPAEVGVVDGSADVSQVESPESVKDDQTTDATANTEKEASEKVAPETKPVAKDVIAPVDEAFDPVAFLMDNPPIIGAGLGALLLALLGVNLVRKRKQNQQDDDAMGSAHSNDSDDLDLGDDLSEHDLDSFDASDLGGVGQDDLTSDIEQSASVEDMIAEADRYLSYNRPDPARSVLEKGIESQPDRIDLRLKMLAVLSTLGDQVAMAEQVEFINANGSDADIASAAEFHGSGEVNEDFASDFGLDDDFSSADATASSDDLLNTSDFSSTEDTTELDFDLDGLDLNNSAESGSDLDFTSELDSSDSLNLDSLGSSDDSADLDLTLDTASDSNEMEFDLSDFESSSNEDISLDSPQAVELDNDLDALSLDSSDGSFDFNEASDTTTDSSDFDFELNDSDNTGLEFGSLDSTADDIPELSADDDLSLDNELNDLAGSTEGIPELESESSDIDLGSLDGSDDFEFSSPDNDSQTDDSLPDFEEGLSLDDDDGELPDLSDDAFSELDSELDALAGDQDLPTLESASDDLDGLPDLENDLDFASAAEAPTEKPVEEVAAEYKESLPTLDDAGQDDLPPLGDPEDIDLDNLDSDLDFLSGTDESETKLDLARAYIDMEDQDGAREILQEVLEDGNDEQKVNANKLIDSLA